MIDYVFSAYEHQATHQYICIFFATAAAGYNCGHYCSFCLCSLECLRELCTCCLMRFIWPANGRWAEIKGGGSGHWHDLQNVAYGEHPSSDVWQVWGQWLVSISSVKNGESNSSWWCMFLDLDKMEKPGVRIKNVTVSIYAITTQHQGILTLKILTYKVVLVRKTVVYNPSLPHPPCDSWIWLLLFTSSSFSSNSLHFFLFLLES